MTFRKLLVSKNEKHLATKTDQGERWLKTPSDVKIADLVPQGVDQSSLAARECCPPSSPPSPRGPRGCSGGGARRGAGRGRCPTAPGEGVGKTGEVVEVEVGAGGHRKIR